MEVTNTTDEDAKYKVSGGTHGSGMNPQKPFDVEEATQWPTLPPGGRVEHKPKASDTMAEAAEKVMAQLK